MYEIPLSVPLIQGNEWKYVKECLDSEWVSSAGKYVNLFEDHIASYTGSKHAIACVNGTAALQVALRLANLQPGNEVIVPTLTFIAPINAVFYNNASPIFMDADEHYNINTEKTIDFIKNETVYKNGSTYNKVTNKKIPVILPVHIWGNAINFEELYDLCIERNITIVEDASESLGSNYNEGHFKGKHTGTIGRIGCISFNGNKIITAGGGGMIITDNEKLFEKAKYLTTQAKDDPIRYVHDEIGYNYRLTNIQAALGVAQLEQLPQILKNKRKIHNYYKLSMKNMRGLSLSKVPEYANNNLWMNLLHIGKETTKSNCETYMKKFEENLIQTRPVWKLNHLQKPYLKFQTYKIEKANDLVDNSLCLPSSSNLTDNNLNKIISVLNE